VAEARRLVPKTAILDGEAGVRDRTDPTSAADFEGR
jgi:hypothetical protein